MMPPLLLTLQNPCPSPFLSILLLAARPQAYGAGELEALPLIFQRGALFLAAHAAPISCAVLTARHWLPLVAPRDAELAGLAARYMALLLPAVWLDAVQRPLTRVLVAQRVTAPQAACAFAIVPLHLATNWLLVKVCFFVFV